MAPNVPGKLQRDDFSAADCFGNAASRERRNDIRFVPVTEFRSAGLSTAVWGALPDRSSAIVPAGTQLPFPNQYV